MKKQSLFCRGNFTLFMSKSCQIWDHIFSLLFPRDSENLNSLDIGLREMGAKRQLNRVRKCDVHTNIRRSLLIERIGPEGRFFENKCVPMWGVVKGNYNVITTKFFVKFNWTWCGWLDMKGVWGARIFGIQLLVQILSKVLTFNVCQ